MPGKRDSATMTTLSLSEQEESSCGMTTTTITGTMMRQTRPPPLQKTCSVPNRRYEDGEDDEATVDYSPPPPQSSEQSKLFSEIIDHAVQTPKSVVRQAKRYTHVLQHQSSCPSHCFADEATARGYDHQFEMEVEAIASVSKQSKQPLPPGSCIRNSASRVRKHFSQDAAHQLHGEF
jgi:hypothetical protein